MTSRRGRPWRGALLALGVLAASGCVYYPNVRDLGGVRLRPTDGRVQRAAADELVVSFILHSTGKYGDILVGAEAPVARRAELRTPAGAVVSEVEIPGESIVTFQGGGPRVVLTGLTRTPQPGEVVLVTLHFRKSGALGLLAVVE
jgi:copper(I)-binding protein